MAYDAELAERLRAALQDRGGITEKRMMGGVCFFLDGNMIGGADRAKSGARRFMFRVGKEREAAALARPGAAPVEFTGRRMGGMVFVDEAACGADALKAWLDMALAHAATLPPKGAEK